MSRLNDLIRQLREREPALAADIEREVGALADCRAFGLNFERHTPEAVELPGRRVRRGDKVRVLPPRGTRPTRDDERLWLVDSLTKDDGVRMATLRALDGDHSESVVVDDLVVVAEFRDPIYPGLVSTGRIERGGDQPFHTVINAENFHALQTLLFTHRGKVDCVYIDPPYNSGARDWKYNNDYVETDDLYRHSKWLAFMERRLALSKELLRSEDSLMIVTIDEREYLRLGLLLRQVFPDAHIQMVSSVVSQKGVWRDIGMTRVDEYIFFVFLGRATLERLDPAFTGHIRAAARTQVWYPLLRTGTDATRRDRPGCFYPIRMDAARSRVLGCGDALPVDADPTAYAASSEENYVLPIASDGSEGRWQMGPEALRQLIGEGMVKLGRANRDGHQPIMYIRSGMAEKIRNGDVPIAGRDADGTVEVSAFEGTQVQGARTQWNNVSHDATLHGSNLLKQLIPGRRFPFPKSLFAVEDTLRWYLNRRPTATVLDFFAGSGTTAHAVFRLNKQDGGTRQSISITNNETAADEQAVLRDSGMRPGDPDWESKGIAQHITEPRIRAAVTGLAPDSTPLSGNYKYTDESPLSSGFLENLEFFDLTYEAPLRMASNREFNRIAPLLWMRAGSRGRRIDDMSGGWDVADAYGVIADFDDVGAFLDALAKSPDATHAFVITDDDWLFQSVCRGLPEYVEPVRLYEAYLRNFEFEAEGLAR